MSTKKLTLFSFFIHAHFILFVHHNLFFFKLSHTFCSTTLILYWHEIVIDTHKTHAAKQKTWLSWSYTNIQLLFRFLVILFGSFSFVSIFLFVLLSLLLVYFLYLYQDKPPCKFYWNNDLDILLKFNIDLKSFFNYVKAKLN